MNTRELLNKVSVGWDSVDKVDEGKMTLPGLVKVMSSTVRDLLAICVAQQVELERLEARSKTARTKKAMVDNRPSF